MGHEDGAVVLKVGYVLKDDWNDAWGRDAADIQLDVPTSPLVDVPVYDQGRHEMVDVRAGHKGFW